MERPRSDCGGGVCVCVCAVLEKQGSTCVRADDGVAAEHREEEGGDWGRPEPDWRASGGSGCPPQAREQAKQAGAEGSMHAAWDFFLVTETLPFLHIGKVPYGGKTGSRGRGRELFVGVMQLGSWCRWEGGRAWEWGAGGGGAGWTGILRGVWWIPRTLWVFTGPGSQYVSTFRSLDLPA